MTIDSFLDIFQNLLLKISVNNLFYLFDVEKFRQLRHPQDLEDPPESCLSAGKDVFKWYPSKNIEDEVVLEVVFCDFLEFTNENIAFFIVILLEEAENDVH